MSNDLPVPQTAQVYQCGIPDCHERYPWERQPGETAKAFLGFAQHRDQGPTRSLRKTCRLTYGEGVANLSQIKKWAKRYAWAERVEAWDKEQDRLRRLTLEEYRRRADLEHVEYGQKLIDKGIRRLETLGANDLTAKEALACLREGVKIQRAVLGMTSEKNREDGPTAHVHRGSMIQQILAEAKAAEEEHLRRLKEPKPVEQLPHEQGRSLQPLE